MAPEGCSLLDDIAATAAELSCAIRTVFVADTTIEMFRCIPPRLHRSVASIALDSALESQEHPGAARRCTSCVRSRSPVTSRSTCLRSHTPRYPTANELPQHRP